VSACTHHWYIVGSPSPDGYYAFCRRCHAQRFFVTEPPPRDPPPEELRMRARELNWEGWFRRLEWESGEGVLSRLRRNRRTVHGTRL
jgi:hypothetical protein